MGLSKSDNTSTPLTGFNPPDTPTKSHERVTLRGRTKIFKGEKREYCPSPSSGDDTETKAEVMLVKKKSLR